MVNDLKCHSDRYPSGGRRVASADTATVQILVVVMSMSKVQTRA
jgi:hypothetical protein